MSPIVSVIMPVYNSERYLQKSLDSLFSQTIGGIELICIDDGSTDGSNAILDAFADSVASKDSFTVKVIHQKNSGVSRARNVGLDSASGKYILFVDSDDYVAPNACAFLTDLAEKESADIVVFGGKTFPTLPWADDSFATREVIYRNDGLQAVLEERGASPLMCNKLYKRDFLEKHHCRLDETLVVGEDNAFQFCVFPYASTIVFTPEPLYFYRIHNNAAVASRRSDHDKLSMLHLDVVECILRTWKQNGWINQVDNQILAWSMLFLFRETSQTSFSQRIHFAEKFIPMMDTYFSGWRKGGAIDRDDATQYRMDFMSLPAEGTFDEPMFSLIVYSPDGAEPSVNSKRGILFQTEENYEILVEPYCDPHSPFSRSTAQMAQNDNRIKHLNGVDPANALSVARGEYVLRIAANEVLDCSMFQQVQEMIDDCKENYDTEPDCITYTDSTRLLNSKDVYEYVDPDERNFKGSTPVVSADQFGEDFCDAMTCFDGNKIFKRKYLSNLDASYGSWKTLELVGARRCERILLTTMPYLTLLTFEFHSVQAAREYFQREVSTWEEIYQQVPELNFSRGVNAGPRARYLLVLGLLCPNQEDLEAAFEAFRKIAGPNWAVGASFDKDSDDLIPEVATSRSMDCEEFYEWRSKMLDKFALCNRIDVDSAASMRWIQTDLERRAKESEARVRAIEGSRSYKLGNAIAKVPRMIKSATRR